MRELLRNAGLVPSEDTDESAAHRFLNFLVQLWTLGLVAVIVVPVLSGNAAAGLLVGVTAAAVLFVPWLIGLVILLVLRSTTRAR